MTNCNYLNTINLKLNRISTAPGGAVLNKNLQYKSRGTWYKFKFAKKISIFIWISIYIVISISISIYLHSYLYLYQREPQPEAAVSLRKMVTFVT